MKVIDHVCIFVEVTVAFVVALQIAIYDNP